jgi:hypothetical protein
MFLAQQLKRVSMIKRAPAVHHQCKHQTASAPVADINWQLLRLIRVPGN